MFFIFYITTVILQSRKKSGKKEQTMEIMSDNQISIHPNEPNMSLLIKMGFNLQPVSESNNNTPNEDKILYFKNKM